MRNSSEMSENLKGTFRGTIVRKSKKTITIALLKSRLSDRAKNNALIKLMKEWEIKTLSFPLKKIDPGKRNDFQQDIELIFEVEIVNNKILIKPGSIRFFRQEDGVIHLHTA